jgi:hypothetical protein
MTWAMVSEPLVGSLREHPGPVPASVRRRTSERRDSWHPTVDARSRKKGKEGLHSVVQTLYRACLQCHPESSARQMMIGDWNRWHSSTYWHHHDPRRRGCKLSNERQRLESDSLGRSVGGSDQAVVPCRCGIDTARVVRVVRVRVWNANGACGSQTSRREKRVPNPGTGGGRSCPALGYAR